eukprot:1184524-Prorocentrum_minimum.AAC.3
MHASAGPPLRSMRKSRRGQRREADGATGSVSGTPWSPMGTCCDTSGGLAPRPGAGPRRTGGGSAPLVARGGRPRRPAGHHSLRNESDEHPREGGPGSGAG